MPSKSKGEYAVAIHKAVADLNCLMANAAGDGLRVDLDTRTVQTVRGGYSVATVSLWEKVTP